MIETKGDGYPSPVAQGELRLNLSLPFGQAILLVGRCELPAGECAMCGQLVAQVLQEMQKGPPAP